ncbi:MAG: DNA photolyase [Phycisphaerae bacterium]
MKNVETRIHLMTSKKGIRKSPKFDEKELATHAVNGGLKCGHDCLYCSTGVSVRRHKKFKEVKEDPFAFGYAIVDPDISTLVAKDAQRLTESDLVQLCTIVDAWSPEAQQYNLGRRCLEALLTNTLLKVRILTKNAAVAKDFDLIEKYRDRVLVGLSLTGTQDKDQIMHVIEPNASLNSERMAVLKEAHERGLRTYGMLCPLLPGIADSPEQIDELVKFVVDCGAEEIFAEAVNRRGRNFILTQEALERTGYCEEAVAVEKIRNKKLWSAYATRLIQNLQTSVRRHFDIEKLRVLLYPKNLQPLDKQSITQDDAGIVWL